MSSSSPMRNRSSSAGFKTAAGSPLSRSPYSPSRVAPIHPPIWPAHQQGANSTSGAGMQPSLFQRGPGELTSSPMKEATSAGTAPSSTPTKRPKQDALGDDLSMLVELLNSEPGDSGDPPSMFETSRQAAQYVTTGTYVPITYSQPGGGAHKSDVVMGSTSACSSAASSRAGSPSLLTQYHQGEQRLRINFINFGVLTEPVQYVKFRNREDAIVPDGLSGTNEVYHEKWLFEIHYFKHESLSRPVLEWTIMNLTSGTRTVRVETETEAVNREIQAKTICNKVLKAALDSRAVELEFELSMTPRDQVARIANLDSKIKAMKPTRLLVGPLFFGLQHRSVQEKVQEMLRQKDAPVFSSGLGVSFTFPDVLGNYGQ